MISVMILLDNFCNKHIGMFDASKDKSNLSCMGKNGDICLKVDIKLFKKHMKAFGKKYDLLNRKIFFIAIHYAYEMALGNDVSKKTTINFQLHTPNENRIRDFLIDFPKSKYLGTYREPIRALYSHIRHHRDNKIEEGNTTYTAYHSVYDGLYLWYYQHQLIGWKQIAVKLNLNILPVKRCVFKSA